MTDLITEQPESTDPAYLAWKEAKIRKAQETAHRDREKLISHAEMRKRLGLEH
ncbi:MAG: hypothetical protein AAFY56_02475 [Pseudomonadota bacterium]